LVIVNFLSVNTKAGYTFSEPVNLGPPISQGPHLGSIPGEWDPEVSADGLSLYFSSLRTDGHGSADNWVSTRPTISDPWDEPVNLGAGANSASWDSDPTVSADGLFLFFMSERPGGQGNRDIWMSQRNSLDSPWAPAENLGAGINSAKVDRGPNISVDGLTLYFDSNRGGSRDIYQAVRTSVHASWHTAVVSRVPNVNSSAEDGYPFISSDGLSLYFSSKRSGTRGDRDLYVATRASIESPWTYPVNLGDVINTPYSDFGPSISSDGLSLYFCQPGLLFVAKRQTLSESFGTPQSLTSNETSAQLSADGLALYFTSDRPGGIGYADDIWVSFRETPNSPWLEPVNLGENINAGVIDNAPSLSLDGLELYFRGDMDGSESDLFVSTRMTTDDPWGPAVNLGEVVNSPDYDYDPVLSSDGLMLIFASDRTGGRGQADLWMTQRSALGEPWQEPENLGAPVNTGSYDQSPCLSSNGRWLFFLSDQSATGWFDLKLSQLEESVIGRSGEKTYTWGKSVNLTRQLDLHEDIWSVSLSADDCTLYFSSCHSRDAKTGLDIWQMDILPVVDIVTTGIVDELDVMALMEFWGTDTSQCDIGPTPLGDGIVDEKDLLVLAEYMVENARDLNDF